MQRAWTATCVLLVALMATYALALDVPTEAEMLVTDSESRIVGVGHVVAGERFDLVLEEGFAGPASLLWLAPDGGVRTIEVVVADGAVWVDGVDLTSLLPETFAFVRVRRATELGDAWPPDVGQGPPAGLPGPAEGRGPPADGPSQADPPGPPDGPPGPPEDGPPRADPPRADPPRADPPRADPPGPPEDAPGRRP